MKAWPVPEKQRARLAELLQEQAAAAAKLKKLWSTYTPDDLERIHDETESLPKDVLASMRELQRASMKLAHWSDANLIEYELATEEDGFPGAKTASINYTQYDPSDGDFEPRVPEFEADEYFITDDVADGGYDPEDFLEDAAPTNKESPSYDVMQSLRNIVKTGYPKLTAEQKKNLKRLERDLVKAHRYVHTILENG